MHTITTWHNTIWQNIIRHDMTWFNMIWQNITQCNIASYILVTAKKALLWCCSKHHISSTTSLIRILPFITASNHVTPLLFSSARHNTTIKLRILSSITFHFVSSLSSSSSPLTISQQTGPSVLTCSIWDWEGQVAHSRHHRHHPSGGSGVSLLHRRDHIRTCSARSHRASSVLSIQILPTRPSG